MLEVSTANYVGDYSIHLVFNDGKAGTADLEQVIFADDRSVFSKLRKKSVFAQFKVAHSTVIWSDELDIASEYLYFLAFRDDPELLNKFIAWGYLP